MSLIVRPSFRLSSFLACALSGVVCLATGCGLSSSNSSTEGATAGATEAASVEEPAARSWYERSFTERIFGVAREPLNNLEVVDPDRQATMLSRGAYLVKAAACGSCHGSKPGDESSPLIGGLLMQDSFGPVRVPNITPDKLTGIGDWQPSEVMQAIRASIGKEGRPLSLDLHSTFRWMSDADAQAIALYLRSLPAVKSNVDRRELGRFEKKRLGLFPRHQEFSGYVPDAKSNKPEVYGRYLATHVSGCYSCHTPQGGIIAEAIPFSGSNREEKGFLTPIKSLFQALSANDEDSSLAGKESEFRALLSRDGQKDVLGEGKAAESSVAANAEKSVGALGDNADTAVANGLLPVGGPDIRGGSEGGLLSWSVANIVSYLQSGNRPDGKRIDGRLCPWPYFSQMTDEDQRAIALFIKKGSLAKSVPETKDEKKP